MTKEKGVKRIACDERSAITYGATYRWHMSKTPIDMPTGCHATIMREMASTCLHTVRIGKQIYITELIVWHGRSRSRSRRKKKKVSAAEAESEECCWPVTLLMS